jgi:hypothetical protein
MAAEIQGHPAVELHLGEGPPTLITVCAECGELRTILFLSRDRWFCTRCRAEGAAPPNLYPVA